VMGQAPDRARRALPRRAVELGDPDLRRAVAGVALALVGANDDDVVLELRFRARIAAVVGDKDEPFAIGREGEVAVEVVVIDAAMRLIGAAERNGGTA